MRTRKVIRSKGWAGRGRRRMIHAAFGGRTPTNRRLKETLEMARQLRAAGAEVAE